MEAIHSPSCSQSLSLIPRSSPPLSGIPPIHLQFLRPSHRFPNSKLSGTSRKRKTSSSSSAAPANQPLRVVASLSSGQILVVVVAAVSTASFVYLNYFSRLKKRPQKVSPSLAPEQPEKQRDGVTSDSHIQDLSVDAFHVENVKEVEQSMGETMERVFEKDVNDYEHQLLTVSAQGNTQTVNALESSDSLHNEQHASPSWHFEGNEEVCLPLQIKVPEPSIVQSFASATEVSESVTERCHEGTETGSTVPAYYLEMGMSSSGSDSDTGEENILKTSNDHVDHETKESGKEELHLFYDEDQSISTVQKVLHGIPELCSQASYPVSYHISATTSSDTVELLKEDHHFISSGHIDQNGSLLTYKRSDLLRRKEDLEEGEGTETCTNIGLLSLEGQHLSLSRRESVHVKENPRRTLGTYHHLLRHGRLQQCVTLLEEMDKEGELDMNKVYHSKYLSLCRSQKAVNEAFRFVKLIPNPTMSTFNMLMSVCSSAQDSEGAAKVWELVQEAGFKGDCKLYTTMISTYGKSGKVDTMFKVFHEMYSSGVEPNLHTYGALIDGCARSGQVAKAFGAYGILRSKKVKPDRVIFNALITACGQSGAVDRAFSVLQEMRDEPHPIDPDHITIGALMKACINVGQVDRVEEVYEMTQQYNIKGTAELYTIAVRSCSQMGDWEFACNIYNDMRKNGVEPDEMFLSTLIDVAGHAGDIDAAFEVLQEARLEGMKMGIMPYSSLMGACCSTRRWRKALELYEEIKALSLVPTVTTMNALITVLCSRYDYIFWG